MQDKKQVRTRQGTRDWFKLEKEHDKAVPYHPAYLISGLQSPSAVILDPKKMKSDNVSIVSSSICHEVMGLMP